MSETPPDGESNWTPPPSSTPPPSDPPAPRFQPPAPPSPRYEPPRYEPPAPPQAPRYEPPRYEPPRYESPRYEPPPPTGPPPLGTPPPGTPPPYGYPATPYPGTPYGAWGAAPEPARAGVLRTRAARRPSPRFGVTLAAAGVALAVIGALIISFDQFANTSSFFDDGSGNGVSTDKTPGILICLVVVLLGYGVAAQGRTGPLGAAGVLATLIGLPALLEFIFIDVNNGSDPFNLSGVLGIATAAFVLAYLLGPTRGHPAYLGAAALALWLFVLDQVQSLVAAPVQEISVQISGDPTAGPNLTGLGIASLVIGIGYLVTTAYLDRKNLSGAATAFLPAGIAALAVGFDLLASKLEQAGTGILVVIAGIGLIALGVSAERRFSSWLGGLWVLGGVVTVLADVVHDAVPAGITLIIVGVVVVVGAYFATAGLREPLETDPGPSLRG